MRIPPFPDPEKSPTDEALAAVIGKDFRIVTAAMDQLRNDHRTTGHSYRFSKTSGWYVVHDKGKQRICYLFPKRGGFLLKIVFNDKGVAALTKAEVGNAVKEKLRSAKKVAEGTVLEFTAVEITSKGLTDLLRIKVASMR